MPEDHKSRERKVDANKLKAEQVDKLAEQIGKNVADLLNESTDKCNKLLNIYDMEVVIQWNIRKKEK